MEGAKSGRIFGEPVAVRAKVFTIGGFSAHADQADLLAWVGHFAKESKPRVFCIHGEPTSSQALERLVRERFGLEAYVPRWGDVLRLDPRERAPEIIPAAPPVDLRQSMLALTADLEAETARLKERLAAKAKEVSGDDLERLREIRDELKAVLAV